MASVNLCTEEHPASDWTGQVLIDGIHYPCRQWSPNLCKGKDWGQTCDIPAEVAAAYGNLTNSEGWSEEYSSVYVVNFNPVPEPGVTVGVIVGLVVLLLMKRWRR